LGASADAETGSRASTEPCSTVSALTGFDPARMDEQAVAEFNLPSVRTIRTLRNQGLPTVKLGAARLIDYDDMVNFIERRKMPRRNTGYRLRWIDRRQSFYIVWYEQGRERLRATGETDGKRAEAASRRSSGKPATSNGPRPAHEVNARRGAGLLRQEQGRVCCRPCPHRLRDRRAGAVLGLAERV
jgi:hypothetical protein